MPVENSQWGEKNSILIENQMDFKPFDKLIIISAISVMVF